MLKCVENIALQSLQIFYIIVLRAKIVTTFGSKMQQWQFPHVIQKYKKLANFARLYFLYFTAFRDQI